jgi:hypothetical protein
VTAQGEDILAFLDTAIRQREHSAHLAKSEGGPEWGEDPFVYGVRDQTHTLAIRVRENRTSLLAHIALNDPASVLRRCAADRKLLALHRGSMHSCPAADDTGYLDEWTQFGYNDTCPVLRALAEGYGWTEGDR